jgi:dethiobiotin synthase
MKASGFFITGTDTDVGKTFVARLLCDALSAKHRVAYLKPVQTGCSRDAQGEFASPDFEFVCQGKSAKMAAYDVHVPFRFAPACSPHLAAKLAGVQIELSRIAACAEELSRNADVVVAEGAGGVLCPLSESLTMLDLMRMLALPVILVTTPRLGTLNHTALSLRALRDEGLPVAAVVCNNCANLARDDIYTENINMIGEMARPAAFFEVKYGAAAITNIGEIFRAIDQPL